MSYLEELNNIQLGAVDHDEGPALVLAGAGSGKTRIVTYRIARMLERGIPASAILAVTFTNKAAAEMRDRVERLTERLTDGFKKHYVTISTFHSLGVRILRESIAALGYGRDFIIYDEEDSIKLIRSCLIALDIKDKDLQPKMFKQLISGHKNKLLPPGAEECRRLGPKKAQAFPYVYSMYQAKLEEYNALDFDDLLFVTVRLFRECPDVLKLYQDRWRFLLIDEYQDTNAAQYALVKMLVEKTSNIFVVGDPDQSIYSWRGANIENILNFEKDYPGAKVVRLEQNYRSTNTILEAANRLIKYNSGRYEKELWSSLGYGEKVVTHSGYNEYDEADFVCDNIEKHYNEMGILRKDMVIFYRTNFQSRIFEDVLLSRQIPYVVVGGVSFYRRREIKDILAFLRIVISGADFISFMRTINLSKRGIGEATIKKIFLAAEKEAMPVVDFCDSVIKGEKTLPGSRFSSRQKNGLESYIAVIRELRAIAAEAPLRMIVDAVVNKTQYNEVLKADPETYSDRKANVEELIHKAAEWEDRNENGGLEEFLEELSLRSNLDDVDDSHDRINLMTIHNGKGLEFRAAFLVGMEEGLFPHINSSNTLEGLEEERRLCYVGMTRAKEFLYLSASRYRTLWGDFKTMKRSRFIYELKQK